MPTRSNVDWVVENRSVPPLSMPMTNVSPLPSNLTVCEMLTMSAGPGTRAGLQLAGDDHEPLVALRMLGLAAKFGTWSFGVCMT